MVLSFDNAFFYFSILRLKECFSSSYDWFFFHSTCLFTYVFVCSALRAWFWRIDEKLGSPSQWNCWNWLFLNPFFFPTSSEIYLYIFVFKLRLIVFIADKVWFRGWPQRRSDPDAKSCSYTLSVTVLYYRNWNSCEVTLLCGHAVRPPYKKFLEALPFHVYTQAFW